MFNTGQFQKERVGAYPLILNTDIRTGATLHYTELAAESGEAHDEGNRWP
jgi:hypothetical protein